MKTDLEIAISNGVYWPEDDYAEQYQGAAADNNVRILRALAAARAEQRVEDVNVLLEYAKQFADAGPRACLLSAAAELMSGRAHK